MVTWLFADDAQATASGSSGQTAPAQGTSESWTMTALQNWPTAVAGVSQYAIADTTPGFQSEVIWVTSGSAAPTVTRGAEGTTPIVHPAGATYELVITQAFLSTIFANPMSALGDLIYENAGLTAARLAGSTAAYRKMLTQTGTGSVSAAPAWMAALPWFDVRDYGADPTGGSASDSAFTAAQALVPASGGVIYTGTGTYRVNNAGSIVNPVTPTYYVGDGWQATTINFYGTGDCFRMFNPVSGGGFLFGGGIHGMTIDGTNAGAGSAGIHAGDSGHLSFDVQVRNFGGAGSMGVHFDNTIWWTEKLKGVIYAHQNTAGVVFDVSGAGSGAGPSFAYGNLDIWINCLAGQDGVVLQNGAYLYHERLNIRGNMAGSTSAISNAVLRITGRLGSSGGYSRLRHSELTIGVESNGGTNIPADQPQTIAVGSPGNNVILGCHGQMDFGGGNTTMQPSNLSPSTTGMSFTFMGPVYGDTSLNPVLGSPATGGPTASYFGAMILPQAAFSGSTGAIMSASGDMSFAQLSANVTISLNPATGNQGSVTLSGPQRKTVLIQQAASGGPYTVTWPVNASPTISSPTVLWPGGIAPVMSATPSAMDVYQLTTMDGATWEGQAFQGSKAQNYGGVFGDGSDGSVTFDGTTTILGLVPSSSTYSLTRDIFCTGSITINSGVTIKSGGWRMFCSGSIVNNGTIQVNGSAGAAGGGSGGGGGGTGSFSNGKAGGAGTTTAGGAGSNTNGPGAAAGGAGGAGTNAAGAGGTAANSAAVSQFRANPTSPGVSISASNTFIAGGGGGGAGGGSGTVSGGGGGGGGGAIMIAGYTVVNNGTISANGGAGGSPGATGCGGGGGGGGGLVLVFSLVAWTPGTVTANGGGAGTGGGGGGVNGTAGNNGTVLNVLVT